MNILFKVSDFFNWAYRYINELTFAHIGYLRIFISITIFIISLFTSIQVFIMKRIWPLLITGTLIYLYSWFNFIEKSVTYYGLFILQVLLLHTFKKYLEMERSWKENNKVIKGNLFRNWIVYSLMVSIILVSISAFLPRNFDPITSRALDGKIQEVFPQLSDWRNNQKTSYKYGNEMRFDMSLTQYQEDSKRLGGPIKKENKFLVMKVTSDDPLYLRGRIKDFYTGSYWKSSEEYFKQQQTGRVNDMLEEYDVEGEEITLKIENIGLVTSTVFNSYILKRISMDSEFFYINEEYETYSEKLIMKNSEYTLYAIKPNVKWSTVKYSQYRPKEDFQKYFQLPEMLPQRVVDLAREITRYHNSDYEKAKALEAYLRDKYVYTLATPQTPYNRDFVDYFLFDLKEGYCTYYATALTVMARSIGIPARYVEGFITPGEKIDGKYYVYGDNAHAWSEIYIEGYGWMNFEATPSYSEVVYSETEEIDTEEDSESEVQREKEIDRQRRKDIEDNLSLEGYNDYISRDINFSKKEFRVGSMFKYLMLFIIILLIFFLARIIFNVLKVNSIFRKLWYKDNRAKVLEYYKYIINLLVIAKEGKLWYETGLEYSNRLNLDIWNTELKFKEITSIFYKARYGKEEISDEEFSKLKYCLEKCERFTKGKVGVIRFGIFKYISMSIYK